MSNWAVLRVLRDGQPAAAPDRPHSQGPVRAGPGKEDADRPLLPIFRQRAEEEVDGHPNAVLLDRLGQIEDSVADAQVLIGRNDVNAVRLNGHGVLRLNDLHARVLGHEFRQQTRVGGRQVLDDDESRSAVGGHGREETLEGPQRTGRPAQPDHRDARRTASRFRRLLASGRLGLRDSPSAAVASGSWIPAGPLEMVCVSRTWRSDLPAIARPRRKDRDYRRSILLAIIGHVNRPI